jgi:hypothetical protein
LKLVAQEGTFPIRVQDTLAYHWLADTNAFPDQQPELILVS